jgi:hypothetical protein
VHKANMLCVTAAKPLTKNIGRALPDQRSLRTLRDHQNAFIRRAINLHRISQHPCGTQRAIPRSRTAVSTEQSQTERKHCAA